MKDKKHPSGDELPYTKWFDETFHVDPSLEVHLSHTSANWPHGNQALLEDLNNRCYVAGCESFCLLSIIYI